MADSELNIILRLTDEVTTKMEKVRSSIKDMGKEVQQTGRQLNMFGRNVMFLGAAITGPLAIAFKTASEYSTTANRSMEDLKNATINLQTAIGSQLAPVMTTIASIVQSATNWFNSLDEETRKNIVQFVFLGGILLTVGGAVLSLTGRVLQMTGAFVAFAAANAPLLIMAGIVVALIMNWEKFRAVVMPILAVLDTLMSMAAIGALRLAQGFTVVLDKVADLVTNGLTPFFWALYALDKDGKIITDEMATRFINASEKIKGAGDRMYADLSASIQAIQEHLSNVMVGGGLAGMADSGVKEIDGLIAKVNELVKKIQAGFSVAIHASTITLKTDLQSVSGYFSAVVAQAGQMAGAIVGYLQVAQGESQKFAVAIKAIRIAETIMNTATAIMLAWATQPYPISAAIATLAAATGAAQIATIAATEFHKGGVVKAHDGLAVDEVPIIAQTGEGILSRRGMAALGGAGALNRLNAGGAGGTNISINMENVSFRNEDDIEDVMVRLGNLIMAKTRSKV